MSLCELRRNSLKGSRRKPRRKVRPTDGLKEKILLQMELEKTIYDKLNEEGKNPELDAYFKGLRTAYNLVLEMIGVEENGK